ncbi:hypothetical protein GCM10009760_31170 [Kitasatospora kazusensis]|uniref:Uncharacterized protein n=1 Tax=Kitasatospora kazusensis TaxID=407974 RepID=A0ABP5LAG5_9ACTN
MGNRSAVLTAALALSGLLALAAAGPAAAHGDTIRFDISGGSGGHPRTVASWENDGDPVTEDLAATLSARSADGRQVGPWRLVAVPGSPATFTVLETLPAGRWKVSVESGFPALGRGEADLTVAAAAAGPTAAAPSAAASTAGSTAASTAAGAPAPAVVARSASGGSSGGSGRAAVGIAAACALAVAAAAAVAVAVRRRTRTGRA